MHAALRSKDAKPMLVAAILLFLAKAVFIVATPLRSLVPSQWLIDDSFIVMRVARNVALGLGFSFDGMHPTTGVSMLWTYLTSLNHVLFSRDWAVKATLLESTLCGTIATVIVFAVALRFGGTFAAWITFCLASLMPVLFFNAMNGMETALFTLLLLLAFTSVALPGSTRPSTRGAVAGACAGLALLARPDAIFAIAALLALYAWRFLRNRSERQSIIKESLAFLIAAGALFGLSMLWHLWQTGSLLADNQIGRRAIAFEKHGLDPYVSVPLRARATISAWNFFELEKLWTLALGSSLLGLLALLWAMAQEKSRELALVTGIYLLLFCGTLVLYQWYFPDFHGLRYLNTGAHLILVFLGVFLASLQLPVWRRTILVIVVATMLGLSWYRYFDMARRPVWAANMGLFGQRSEDRLVSFWSTMEWAKEELPAGTVVALRDHGRFAFFTGLPVQDLAGILDPGILEAKRESNLKAYLAEKKATYIYLPAPDERTGGIYRALHDALELEPVEDAPVQEMTGFVLYRIR
jgi:hypothetical protein